MDNTIIPRSWAEFVSLAVEVHVRKDTDYESRFMKVLLDKNLDGKSIWTWEVTKKLDRLRTWVKRGELAVKGEGVIDSIIDLSNYTIQYDISKEENPFQYLTKEKFEYRYNFIGSAYLMRYLTESRTCGITLLDLNDDVDIKVVGLLLTYWAV